LDLETVFWGYIPIVIAIFGIFLSLVLSSKKVKFLNISITSLVLILNVISIYILWQIINGSWPSYTPHIGIGISTILLLIQYGLSKK